MGRISTGTGLISGLDIAGLVDQLIAVDARPKELLARRIAVLDAQRTALLELSARVSAMLSRITSLSNSATFRTLKGTSSNPSALSATLGEGATAGAYTFMVRSLATAHQLVSGGIGSADTLLGAGRISLESSAARVTRDADLDELNGFSGVQRGSFRITDGDGKSATVDISGAQTISDVIDAINSAGTAISAALLGDGLVLHDSTGKTFRVSEIGDDHVAADLGFGSATSGTGELVGADLVSLAAASPLARLRDGSGVRVARGGGDIRVTADGTTFDVDLSGNLLDTTRLEQLNGGAGVKVGRIRITNRDGVQTDVDLSGLSTIGEVRTKLNESGAGVNLIASSGRLILSDTTQSTKSNLKVEDLENGTAAAGLGIAGTSLTDKIDGRTILRIDTLRDVINAVQYATGNNGAVVAEVGDDGKRLRLRSVAAGELTLEALSGSRALADLGFTAGTFGDKSSPAEATGARIVGGLGTTLLTTLNGGRGFAVRDAQGAGKLISIVDALGARADIDVGDAETLDDVVQLINQSGLAVSASVDGTGTRLRVKNAEGTSGSLAISGDFADELGLTGSGTAVRSDNLQRQYVSETTALSTLNGGRGVAAGSIKITNSSGVTTKVDLSASRIKTVGDVINEINTLAAGVRARINDTGDGLLIEDTAGGTLTLKVEDDGGSTAKDLNLTRSAVAGKIDGTYESVVTLAGGETLAQLVARINGETGLARAALVHDGSDANPYRLSITARTTGRASELIVDGSELGIDFSTLTRPQDAVVVVGGDGDSGGLLVRSSSNTLSNVVDGISITLTSTSDEPITLTVDRDLEALTAVFDGLVNDYNGLLERVEQLTDYNADTGVGGVLLGDSTTRSMVDRLRGLLGGSLGTRATLNRLSQLGVIGGSNGRLKFDEEKFREAYENDPAGVEQFFTDSVQGAAKRLKDGLEAITDENGLIGRREDALEEQKATLNGRIDALNVLLERKRERLTRQFLNMEQVLAGLQSQQAALASLAALSAQTGSIFANRSSS
ncbi:MAG: hypothetical protein CHACPFDD_03215 [Phycisphaerae bacterium]|nr:hypothetical protein [Phycisphaerae bacterium]